MVQTRQTGVPSGQKIVPQVRVSCVRFVDKSKTHGFPRLRPMIFRPMIRTLYFLQWNVTRCNGTRRNATYPRSLLSCVDRAHTSAFDCARGQSLVRTPLYE